MKLLLVTALLGSVSFTAATGEDWMAVCYAPKPANGVVCPSEIKGVGLDANVDVLTRRRMQTVINMPKLAQCNDFCAYFPEKLWCVEVGCDELTKGYDEKEMLQLADKSVTDLMKNIVDEETSKACLAMVNSMNCVTLDQDKFYGEIILEN